MPDVIPAGPEPLAAPTTGVSTITVAPAGPPGKLLGLAAASIPLSILALSLCGGVAFLIATLSVFWDKLDSKDLFAIFSMFFGFLFGTLTGRAMGRAEARGTDTTTTTTAPAAAATVTTTGPPTPTSGGATS